MLYAVMVLRDRYIDYGLLSMTDTSRIPGQIMADQPFDQTMRRTSGMLRRIFILCQLTEATTCR